MATRAKAKCLAAAIFLLIGVESSEVAGQYNAVFKLPQGYSDRIQQETFHSRLMGEFAKYDKHPSHRVREWHAHLKSIETASDEFKLDAIYTKAHQLVRYRAEQEDVWSTAGETISRGYGDCDDYANLYIIAASLVGFDMSRAWLVVGQVHTAGKPPIGHAVAVIETSQGRQFVLDNLRGEIVPADNHSSFKPFYSINAKDKRTYLQVNSMFEKAF